MGNATVIKFPCNFSYCQFIRDQQLFSSFDFLEYNKIFNRCVRNFGKKIRNVAIPVFQLIGQVWEVFEVGSLSSIYTISIIASFIF